MKTDVLEKLLRDQHVSFIDGIYNFPEEGEVSFLFETGHEILTISRVKKLTIQTATLMLETHKRERFFISHAAPLLAVKFAETDGDKLRGAGFSARV